MYLIPAPSVDFYADIPILSGSHKNLLIQAPNLNLSYLIIVSKWSKSVSNFSHLYQFEYADTISIGLGLGPKNGEKKGACPARVAEAGQENIETVHEPKPIQAADTL